MFRKDGPPTVEMQVKIEMNKFDFIFTVYVHYHSESVAALLKLETGGRP